MTEQVIADIMTAARISVQSMSIGPKNAMFWLPIEIIRISFLSRNTFL